MKFDTYINNKNEVEQTVSKTQNKPKLSLTVLIKIKHPEYS